jgi:hypothetical protein
VALARVHYFEGEHAKLLNLQRVAHSVQSKADDFLRRIADVAGEVQAIADSYAGVTAVGVRELTLRAERVESEAHLGLRLSFQGEQVRRFPTERDRDPEGKPFEKIREEAEALFESLFKTSAAALKRKAAQ